MKPVKRLNDTYQRLYRNRHLIAKKCGMDDSEYRLWDLYLAIYDWDKTHAATFETFTATDANIAEILGWSTSKVCRARHELLGKKVIEIVERSVYRVKLLPVKENEIANLQGKNAELQGKIAHMQQDFSPVQQNQGSELVNSIVSSKGKYKDYYLQDDYLRRLKNLIGDQWLNPDSRIKKHIETFVNRVIEKEN